MTATIYDLVPGNRYRVVQSFVDFYGNSFQQGELLRFKERFFTPYHDGHTVVFEERSLYLQQETNAPILDNFSDYLAEVTQA